ncbi:hypothetical protein E2C01_053733 [Portunus trituberculatus]|uniref:Uncharacterized protein n=1 Tax=Portunus trituberculatus TaxID=210409 RepID=A0A5B7GQ73_PORTR|nr:hypothetical protein [Portunus trituberculatus]
MLLLLQRSLVEMCHA